MSSSSKPPTPLVQKGNPSQKKFEPSKEAQTSLNKDAETLAHQQPHLTASHQSAVAISYQNESKAPIVVAKGKGLIAEEIIARANANGVFIHQSKELVGLLMRVDLDEQIPPNLYKIVAELLAWLYMLDAASAQKMQNKRDDAAKNI